MKKIILTSILGCFFGGLSGAALVGLPAYFSQESGFMGPYSDWAIFGAFYGLVLGIVPGAVLGFLTSKLKTGVFLGGLVGAAVGSIYVVAFFLFGNDWYLDSEMYNTALACIPIGGAIGLILSLMNRPIKTPQSQ